MTTTERLNQSKTAHSAHAFPNTNFTYKQIHYTRVTDSLVIPFLVLIGTIKDNPHATRFCAKPTTKNMKLQESESDVAAGPSVQLSSFSVDSSDSGTRREVRLEDLSTWTAKEKLQKGKSERE